MTKLGPPLSHPEEGRRDAGRITVRLSSVQWAHVARIMEREGLTTRPAVLDWLLRRDRLSHEAARLASPASGDRSDEPDAT